MDIVGVFTSSVAAGLLLAGAVLALASSFRLMRFPDITIEGSFLIGACVWTALVDAGADTIVATLGAAGAGALCGAATATLSQKLGVDRFLAGILVTAICYSLGLITLNGPNRGLFADTFPILQQLNVTLHPMLVSLLIAGICAGALALFFASRVGLRARAASANPEMFEDLVGGTLPYVAAGLACTNAVTAVTGAAFARYQGFVDIGMGQGVLVTALASLALGEGLTAWLRAPLLLSRLLAAVVGSIAYQFAMALTLAMGAPAAATRMIAAGIVLAFLTLEFRRRRRRAEAE